jgi:hypothetical protein
MCKRTGDWNNNQKMRWLIAQTINELDELVIGYKLI